MVNTTALSSRQKSSRNEYCPTEGQIRQADDAGMMEFRGPELFDAGEEREAVGSEIGVASVWVVRVVKNERVL